MADTFRPTRFIDAYKSREDTIPDGRTDVIDFGDIEFAYDISFKNDGTGDLQLRLGDENADIITVQAQENFPVSDVKIEQVRIDNNSGLSQDYRFVMFGTRQGNG